MSHTLGGIADRKHEAAVSKGDCLAAGAAEKANLTAAAASYARRALPLARDPGSQAVLRRLAGG
jgi:hypothetical protein